MKLSEVGGSSWVAYDEHHRYWSGTYGKSPTAAYREFINAGLKMPADPKMERLRDWVYTRATLRELSARFGLSHPDSASDLIRRGAKRLEQSKQMTFHVNEIEEKLRLNPESRVSAPSEFPPPASFRPQRVSAPSEFPLSSGECFALVGLSTR